MLVLLNKILFIFGQATSKVVTKFRDTFCIDAAEFTKALLILILQPIFHSFPKKHRQIMMAPFHQQFTNSIQLYKHVVYYRNLQIIVKGLTKSV